MQGIARFLDDAGRLTVWPSKHADKQLACEYLITKFEASRSYTEPEVNEIIKQWHSFGDWPLLRRELYERKLIDRDRDSTNYRRSDGMI